MRLEDVGVVNGILDSRILIAHCHLPETEELFHKG